MPRVSQVSRVGYLSAFAYFATRACSPRASGVRHPHDSTLHSTTQVKLSGRKATPLIARRHDERGDSDRTCGGSRAVFSPRVLVRMRRTHTVHSVHVLHRSNWGVTRADSGFRETWKSADEDVLSRQKLANRDGRRAGDGPRRLCRGNGTILASRYVSVQSFSSLFRLVSAGNVVARVARARPASRHPADVSPRPFIVEDPRHPSDRCSSRGRGGFSLFPRSRHH